MNTIGNFCASSIAPRTSDQFKLFLSILMIYRNVPKIRIDSKNAGCIIAYTLKGDLEMRKSKYSVG